MLIVYHSNQPEHFKNLLISIMSEQSLSDPMQSEIIVVENKIMIEWIQIELAKYFGITANITFMDLTTFIKKISNKISSNNFVINDFNCSIMYWKFMEILPQVCLMQNFAIIKRYLYDDIHQRKCGQFSEKLVKLFTNYLIYRPDWLDQWKFNKIVKDVTDSHQLWQSELWRILLKSLKHDNISFYTDINYLQHCVNLLKNMQKIDNDHYFPERMFVFGITSMPSIYWEILHLLSYHIDIYLWFISPYYKFNYDHFFNKNILNITLSRKCRTRNTNISHSYTLINFDKDTVKNVVDTNIHHESNHFFLNFCDYIGKNTLLLLTKLENVYEKRIFFLPKEDSLLHVLQKNVLEFKNHVVINENKYDFKILKKHYKRRLLKLEDQSITCHVCYSMQREIEVLHDNLLLMIENDSLLLQKGVIIMAPNIHNYVTTIKTVFNNIHGRSLPFIISSNHKKYIHPIILTFLNILDISHNKCTSEEILSFLKISLIANKFNIEEKEVKLLYQWTIESGIRWGLDNITIRRLNIPISINQNTWSAGLTRMLLGYAVHDQFSTWEDIFPYNGIDEEHMNIIGQLGEFLRVLQKWRDRFSYSHTLTEWMSYIKEILDDFFCYSKITVEENKVLSFLKDCWKNILEPGVLSGYSETVHIIVLKDKLFHKLCQNTVNYRFLPNVINFCDITPVCCIPCKVVCFIGMNEEKFPRNNKVPLDFDLIKKNSRSNDYNLYNKDCYSFLLAFLLAQEKIYISFIENSIYSRTTNNASILIDVLFEYIAQYFYLRKDEYLDINTNINNIRNHLCRWYSLVPFSAEHFVADSKVQSFASEWVSSANVNTNANNLLYFNFLTPLPKLIIHTISFYDLYNFYRHPIRTWFHKRLGVYFNQNKLKLFDNDDFFSLNMLHRFNLNTKLVDWLIHNNNADAFYKNIRGAGILPYGAFGELFWIKQCSKMKTLVNQIKKFYLFERFNLDIFLTFDNIVLTGQLTMVQKNGLVRWKSAYLSIKDGLLLWLEHLVYCALGGTENSRLFGMNDTWHFPNLSKFKAKEYLFLLIKGYLVGINTPLLLLYKSGGAWINQVFDWNTRTISMDLSRQKKARHKLVHAWEGIKYSITSGEHDDPYIRILMPYNLSEENIEIIIKTAEHYFLFPMKYKIL